MMRERLIALRERRAELTVRVEAQRSEVFLLLERIDHVAAWFDRARAVGREVRANPVWIAAAIAFVVALRPRKAFKFAATAFSLWRGWRRLRATIDRLVSAPGARRTA